MAVEVNPYAAPASAVEQLTSDFGEATILSFKARAGRLRYLTRSMIAFLISYAILTVALMIVVLSTVAGAANMSEEELAAIMAGPALVIPIIVFTVAGLVVSWMLGMQRLHDLNLTGWLHLLILVPFLNVVFWLYLLFAPGSKGPNRYGPPPPPNGVGLKVTAAILLVLFAIGLVGFTAIFITAYSDFAARGQLLQQ